MSAATQLKPSIIPVRLTNYLIGVVEDPKEFFEAERKRMLDEIGDISGIRVTLNRILVQLWISDKARAIKGGGSIIIPETSTTLAENVWQGKTGLVIAMGPHAYEDNEAIQFLPEERCEVGDWVAFRVADGYRVDIFKNHCMMLESERSIRMVLDRPDAVY